jgi:tetratricopeptide (TPR) repeat protein
MTRITKKEFETVFRTSVSADELFDYFRLAIDYKIRDASLFKILLWNKALSTDEVCMFAEKICKTYPNIAYQIYYWVGQIFSSISVYGEYYETAFDYYKKAASKNDSAHEPYVAVTKIYNNELDLPKFDRLTSFIQKGIESADKKSKVCFAAAKLYKRKGDYEKVHSYQRLGEKFQREGK